VKNYNPILTLSFCLWHWTFYSLVSHGLQTFHAIRLKEILPGNDDVDVHLAAQDDNKQVVQYVLRISIGYICLFVLSYTSEINPLYTTHFNIADIN